MAAILEPGTMLGRYRIEERLGTGSISSVYRAWDTTLRGEVAVKVLDVLEPKSLERFRRELVFARRVSHPGICRVFDLHADAERPYITMEYIPGRTLQAILAEELRFEADRVIGLGRALCRALGAAHRLDTVHRNLNPRAVMLGPADRPVILDFGLADAPEVTAVTSQGLSTETMHYVAPELFAGAQATPASDLYAVGMLLYRLLAGRLPYDAASPEALHAARRGGPPAAPSTFAGATLEGLDAVILRAIATPVTERFTEAAAFERALRDEMGAELNADTTPEAPWSGDLERTVTEVVEAADNSGILRLRIETRAVLFSDIVGITPFFETHGDVTGRRFLLRHNRLLFPVIEDHGGTIVKTIGDAIMAMFYTSSDAVAAAVDMQRALDDERSARPDGHEMRVRIGIHSGDAIVEDTDIFGDTVNVAARVSSRAKGDQILISEATKMGVEGVEEAIHFVEDAVLKGKAEPVAVFEVDWRRERVWSSPELGDRIARKRDRTQKVSLPETVLNESPGAAVSVPAAAGGRRSPVAVAVVVAVALLGLGVALWGRGGVELSDAGTDTEPVAVTPTDLPSDSPPEPGADTPTDMPSSSPPVVTPDDGLSPSPVEPPGADEDRSTADPPPRPSPRRDIRQRIDAAERELKKRALLPEDIAAYKKERARALAALDARRWHQAEEAATRALDAVRATMVDRELVTAKLTRFNRAFDAVKDEGQRALVQPALEQVLTAFAAKDYRRANAQLNRAFVLLRR